MFKLPNWNEDCFEDVRDLNIITPEWDVLLQLATVSAGEFAAATMGCQHCVALDAIEASNGGIPCFSFTKNSGRKIHAAFRNRVKVIKNHMEAGTFPQSSNPNTCYLLPTIQWAHNLGWELPEPLMSALEKNTQSLETMSVQEQQAKQVAQTDNERPLSTKERNTLLTIIAALAKEANIDLSRPSKAGETIAHLTEVIGAPVDHATIEQKIKQIDGALESRAK